LQKVDKLAYYSVKTLRAGFDFFSGYTLGTYTGRLDEKQWLRRIIFLETVAGVPGKYYYDIHKMFYHGATLQ